MKNKNGDYYWGTIGCLLPVLALLAAGVLLWL